MDKLIGVLGEEISDPEEESFLVFSQQIPSQNLGFVDPKAQVLEVTVAGKDYTIHQSPGLLASDRKEGTTGAVLWKITPRFADWLASPTNPLTKCGVLHAQACALELGCGVSGLVSLALAPQVKKYVNTDQEYVLKYVRQNIEENCVPASPKGGKGKAGKAEKKKFAGGGEGEGGEIGVMALDWETDSFGNLLREVGVEKIDVLISCDCIYNESLIDPLVRTMAEICRLAPSSQPTVCVVAQQLRSPDIFEAWLQRFHRDFRVWRVPDEELTVGLREGSGFVVHVGFLR